MRRPWLEYAISFLLGVLWALLGLSVALVFLSFYKISLFTAISFSLLVACFWLFLIVILEIANIQIDKLKELKHQSQLLESIEKRLYE